VRAPGGLNAAAVGGELVVPADGQKCPPEELGGAFMKSELNFGLKNIGTGISLLKFKPSKCKYCARAGVYTLTVQAARCKTKI
jgi:hypothetical protein